jgi:radical SAM protein with 4Fe4S-binding SPASM domain
MSAGDYVARFTGKAAALRVPLMGSLDLTYRCNLRCIHCYIPEKERRDPSPEMETGRVIELIDEVVEAGCLFFLISGGEPLLRGDFPAVYRHARESGLLVTLFTNGTVVTEESLALFAELPPYVVEVSVYGATEETYEKVTGVRGSFRKCLAGVERLIERGVKVSLKTMLMSVNRHEFYALEKMAADLGVDFRFDPALFPRSDGDLSPLALRVDPREAVAMEFSSGERRRLWKKFYDRTLGSRFPDRLYVCGAGSTVFHVDPGGALKPCIMTDKVSCDLTEMSFMEGWRDVIGRIRDRKASSGRCGGCDRLHLCGYCPPFSARELGSDEARSEYLCALGEERYQAITGV